MRLSTHVVIRKVVDFLRRPFLHRLVTLITSTLLAMSLVSAALVVAAARSGNEVAVICDHWPAQRAFVASQGSVCGYAFLADMLMSRQEVEYLNVTLRSDLTMERWQRS